MDGIKKKQVKQARIMLIFYEIALRNHVYLQAFYFYQISCSPDLHNEIRNSFSNPANSVKCIKLLNFIEKGRWTDKKKQVNQARIMLIFYEIAHEVMFLRCFGIKELYAFQAFCWI